MTSHDEPDALDRMRNDLWLRRATADDVGALTELIARSVEGLQSRDYTIAQRRSAIGHVFLVDRGLIADGSYFIVQSPDGRLAGAGGWSDRKALHGAHVRGDTGERIDPATEPARIRAYFVDPDFARTGVGSAILERCEAAAREAGFGRAVLGATLTGVPFYARHGYRIEGREETALPEGERMTVVLMSKALVAS